jgi:hypothetical protein
MIATFMICVSHTRAVSVTARLFITRTNGQAARPGCPESAHNEKPRPRPGL